MKTALSPQKALERLETLCAKSERSTGEVRRKLRGWGIGAADAAAIVASLVDRRFVDDRRFAAAYVRDKFRFQRWGRLKIRAGLYAAGVDAAIIADALAQIDPAEYAAVAADIARRRYAADIAAGDRSPRECRQRAIRAAMARGFEPAVVMNFHFDGEEKD